MPRHPVAELLRHHSYAGSEPNTEELAALELAPEHRQAVREVAAECARLHAEGEQGRAHERAYQRSFEIVSELPAAQQDPNYIRPRDPLDGIEDPTELAGRVPRPFDQK